MRPQRVELLICLLLLCFCSAVAGYLAVPPPPGATAEPAAAPTPPGPSATTAPASERSLQPVAFIEEHSVSAEKLREYLDSRHHYYDIHVRPARLGLGVHYKGDNPLALVGVKSGDVLLELDGRPLRSPEDFQSIYAELRSAHPLEILVQRGQRRILLRLSPGQ